MLRVSDPAYKFERLLAREPGCGESISIIMKTVLGCNVICLTHGAEMYDHWSTDSFSSKHYKATEFIAIGTTGTVYGIDDARVLKQCTVSGTEELEIERRAYKRLGSHPSIAIHHGMTEDGSIILERGETLRRTYGTTRVDDIPLRTRLGWAKEAAKGLRYIHEKGIVQADVGCHNMILTHDNHLKFIDFAGCSIDGEVAGACYEWFSYRPSTPEVSIQTDIFAYGCAIFEMETGRPPYYELRSSGDRIRRVAQLYQENRFPDVQSLTLGVVIEKCWRAEFASMNEVIETLSKQDIWQEHDDCETRDILEFAEPVPAMNPVKRDDGKINPNDLTI